MPSQMEKEGGAEPTVTINLIPAIGWIWRAIKSFRRNAAGRRKR